MAAKTLAYFTAGSIPTAAELAEIDAANALAVPAYSVLVMNGAIAHDKKTVDFVAGTIPTAYAGDTDYGDLDAARPLAFKVWPISGSLSHGGGATLQLLAIKTTGTLDAIVNTDVTASTAGTTYASSDEGVATVSAEGLVDTVAEGTCTITATYTYAVGKTLTATCAITVVA